MPEQQISVSPAFAATPQNPNVAHANTVSPDFVPPTQEAPALTPPDVVPPQQQAVVTPPAAPSADPHPTVDPWLVQQQVAMQQLQQQNEELRQRLQTQDTTINNLLQTQQEYEALRQTAAATKMEFGDLTTVDEADARKIGEGVLKAVAAQYEPLRQQLAQQQQYMQQSNQWQETRFRQQKAQDTLNRIVAKHPDFLSLQQDPSYLAFIRQRDGYSYQSRDARAAMEFANGNADYVNNMLDQYKATKPQAGSLTSVAPVQTASAPVAPAVQPTAVPTLKELNDMMQMRQITPDQYRSLVQQSRAAYNLQG